MILDCSIYVRPVRVGSRPPYLLLSGERRIHLSKPPPMPRHIAVLNSAHASKFDCLDRYHDSRFTGIHRPSSSNLAPYLQAVSLPFPHRHPHRQI